MNLSEKDLKIILDEDDHVKQKNLVLELVNLSRKTHEILNEKETKIKVKCKYCFGLFDPSEIVPLREISGGLNEERCDTLCKHKICFNCIKDQAKDQIESNEVFVTCPIDGCKTKFRDYNALQRLGIITEAQKKRYYEKLIKNFKEENVNKECPMCKCLIFYSSKYNNTDKMKCPECKKDFCFQCNCKWHDNYNCQQWQNRCKMEKLHPLLPELYLRGMKYIQEESTKDSNVKLTKVQFNSNILKNCDAWKKFLIGWKEKSCTSLDQGFFCWHGSSEAGVKGICVQGFDPGRRGKAVGQVHGKGEYFGINARHSKWYVERAGSLHMILTFAIKSTLSCTIADKCHVIRNDDNWRSSYCLPLIVVPYTKDTAVDHLDSENPF